jgi:hypothetical protein
MTPWRKNNKRKSKGHNNSSSNERKSNSERIGEDDCDVWFTLSVRPMMIKVTKNNRKIDDIMQAAKVEICSVLKISTHLRSKRFRV